VISSSGIEHELIPAPTCVCIWWWWWRW